MKYRLLHNLGSDDARKCNDAFGASLNLTQPSLEAGAVVELPKGAVDWLTLSRGYSALLEPAGSVKAPEESAKIKGQ